MDVQKSIATCLKKFATFYGRASRSEYWWFQFFYALVSFFVVIICFKLFFFKERMYNISKQL